MCIRDRLTLDDGCYRISFGDHSEDPDAVANEGDVMRIQVTVPQQTGYSTGAVLRQGWVIAKAFTTAKMCIRDSGRGNVMTRSYDVLTGLLTCETYGDGTPSSTAAYNHLGQLTGITDASGTRIFTYNQYGCLLYTSRCV